MPTSPNHLFVYGTLRRSEDFPMHELLLPATFVGHSTFPGELYDVGSYPAAVHSARSENRVHGEVYLLHNPNASFARLDAYEGCAPTDPAPHEYVRAILDVLLETGDTLPTQVYLYNHPVTGLTRVPDGDYLRWRLQRS